MAEEAKPRTFVLIWIEARLSGSHMISQTRWRPFITFLSVKEAVATHEAQFGPGCLVDVIDVSDPDNIRSVFEENV